MFNAPSTGRVIGLVSVFCLLWSLSITAKAGEKLPLAVNLAKTTQTAQQHNIPVVVFYTATWCNYCKKLEENIIHPLLENTPIEDYAEFRQVVIDRADWNIINFSGASMGMKRFADFQGIQVAPTTLIYDHQGAQIAPAIIGLTLEEYYPSNLEKRINQGLKALGNSKRLDIYQLIDQNS